MSGGTLLIVVVAGILAILGGWLVPVVFKSKRPYGLAGDVLVCTIVTVVTAFLSWEFIMPALGFESGWIKVLGSTGDPLFLGLIALWVMRKIKS
jgi:predicted small integral membrane protein